MLNVQKNVQRKREKNYTPWKTKKYRTNLKDGRTNRKVTSREAPPLKIVSTYRPVCSEKKSLVAEIRILVNPGSLSFFFSDVLTLLGLQFKK